MLVEATRAVFGYGGRAIVKIDQFGLRAGQCLGMFGPNGSGKTTLVRGLAGLLTPMSGSIKRAPALRLGYMQQQRMMELHWPMNAIDAAAIASSARRRLGWLSRDALRVIRRSMRLLEVDDLERRPFASLSGGQQQRVLLAGALATDPQMLILDEPTEGLDVRSRRVLLRSLREASASGLAVIMISHSIDDICSLCKEVAWLRDPENAGDPNCVELITAESLVEHVVAQRHIA